MFKSDTKVKLYVLTFIPVFLLLGAGLRLKGNIEQLETPQREVARYRAVQVEYTTNQQPETTTMVVVTEPESTTKAKETTTKSVVTTKRTSEGISYTQEDLDFMAAAICQEAGGESMYVKIRVANVMVNRVLNKNFPNSIEGVLTQRGQYDLYAGRNFPSWATDENIADSYEAAENVLSGAERPFPQKVVFQAEFRQGNGTYEHCDSVLGGNGYYFCY